MLGMLMYGASTLRVTYFSSWFVIYHLVLYVSVIFYAVSLKKKRESSFITLVE